MSYEKQTWATGDIVTSSKLNHMEDGIAGAGGGGVLIVNIDSNGILDKTAGEIMAAFIAGSVRIKTISSENIFTYTGLTLCDYAPANGFVFVAGSGEDVSVYLAATEADYPAINR